MDSVNAARSLQFANELTVAWLSNPNTRAGQDDAVSFLTSMFGVVEKLASQVGDQPASPPSSQLDNGHASQSGALVAGTAATLDQQLPVSIEESLASDDFIISLIDGKPYKALRRHLSRHGLSPADYRQKFGLPDDYPMVAARYSKERRELANRTWSERRDPAKRTKSAGAQVAKGTAKAPARARAGSARDKRIGA